MSKRCVGSKVFLLARKLLDPPEPPDDGTQLNRMEGWLGAIEEHIEGIEKRIIRIEGRLAGIDGYLKLDKGRI